ncbi:hypothetical protein Peur_034440 [Populus x canadensis]
MIEMHVRSGRVDLLKQQSPVNACLSTMQLAPRPPYPVPLCQHVLALPTIARAKITEKLSENAIFEIGGLARGVLMIEWREVRSVGPRSFESWMVTPRTPLHNSRPAEATP